MSHKRKRTTNHAIAPPPKLRGDDTEQAIAELVVLWPRLIEALARDASGPSADSGGVSGGGSATSAAVVDLDTQRVIIRIEQGVQKLAAEARPILGIDNPAKVIALASKLIAQLEADRARGLREVMVVRKQARFLTKPGHPVRSSEAQRKRMHVAGITVTKAAAEIRRHRGHIATAEHRRSTLGILEQLRVWYPQLRDRKQPLAQHIAEDVDGWFTAARAALGLRTHVQPLGRLCPHHREDHATELVRDADEATLSRAVLAGRESTASSAPLRWRLGNQTVRCPHCDERWTGPTQLRVLMRLIDDADAQDDARLGHPRPIRRPSSDPILVTAAMAAVATGRADGTIRAWASSGLITRHGVAGEPDARGRVYALYDLDEVIGVSARANRRERGLIALSQVGELCPQSE